MPPTNAYSGSYFLNPNAGFTPSQGGPVRAGTFQGQTGQQAGNIPPQRPPLLPQAPGPFTTNMQQNSGPGTAVRPTDQSDNPQAAWLQNMATFAGGNLAGSTALGNPQQGPVRRLVDVLGQQPFGEQNPMTLLMQALQQGNYGVQLPTTPNQPANPPIYRPPIYNNPGWGAPVRPVGFNPMQMGTL